VQVAHKALTASGSVAELASTWRKCQPLLNDLETLWVDWDAKAKDKTATNPCYHLAKTLHRTNISRHQELTDQGLV
jgi:hypothetical protein